MASTRRAPNAPPSSTVSQPARPKAASSAPESRGARRKRETREKLLKAAFTLMAQRGVDAVAINEITEAADVGFGSFYNHFASKEAVYEEVLGEVLERFGEALDQLSAPITDPAEVISVCVRHSIARARAEPLWGQFLLREGYREEALTRGLAARLLRDILKGTEAKRFSVSDPLMAVLAAGGLVLGCIALQGAAAGGKTLLSQRGSLSKNLDQRAAATLLRGLGLSEAEAHAIASRPLPALEATSPRKQAAATPSGTKRKASGR